MRIVNESGMMDQFDDMTMVMKVYYVKNRVRELAVKT